MSATQFEEAVSMVKFVRTCIADKIVSTLSSPQGVVDIERDQLFMWRKLLSQALDWMEESAPAGADGSDAKARTKSPRRPAEPPRS